MKTTWHRLIFLLLLTICLLPATLLAAAAPPTAEAARPEAFCDTITDISMEECEALVAPHNSTSGADWQDNRSSTLSELGNFLNQEESGFSGPPQPQDTTGDVSFGTSVSQDGKVTTLVFNFDDLVAVLDSSTDHLVSTRVASFVLPIQSNTDLSVRLDVWGFVGDKAPGTDAYLLIHHVGETRLLPLPDDPDTEFKHSLETTLPAGRDYAVTLLLLMERDSTSPGANLHVGIEEIELV
ncbi:MAG: hypothetical protein ACE5LU_14870, partial [Anaerolineae bacterium]